MSDSELHRESYKAALRLIDAQRRLLEEAGADDKVVTGMNAIIRHLYKLPEKQLDRLFNVSQTAQSRADREQLIRSAASLSLNDVELKVNDDSTSRGELEAIAVGRFHVPKGSTRSLGNVDRLREKIRNFVQNERTHLTITELARRAG